MTDLFKYVASVFLFTLLAACGGSDGDKLDSDGSGGSGTAGTGAGGGTGGTGLVGQGGGPTGGTGNVGQGGVGGGAGGGPSCGPVDTWSACAMGNQGGVGAPPPPAYSGGACPAVIPWDDQTQTYNQLASGRRFIVVAPSNPCPGERFPVVFMWHWISGEAKDWLSGNGLQLAADQFRVIFVAPEAKGATVFGLDTQWPFDLTQPDPRMHEEYVFFDDMLACVSQQFNVNNDCVGSIGISAGGLFNSQLLQHRGNYLSSAIVISGGVGELVRPWIGGQHRLPTIVLWGGPTDNFGGVFNFDNISKLLVGGLASSGHFVIECVHACGHFPPLLTQDANGNNFSGLDPLFEFFLQHPYWLPDGASPYAQGLPGTFPAFCGIGPGGGNIGLSPPCTSGSF